MLVLSRQRDETIMIGDDIEITVVDIRGDKVRLGINAPTRVAVHRKEVYEAIKRENEQASRIPGQELSTVRPGISAASRPLPIKAAALSSGKATATASPDQGLPAARAGPVGTNPQLSPQSNQANQARAAGA